MADTEWSEQVLAANPCVEGRGWMVSHAHLPADEALAQAAQAYPGWVLWAAGVAGAEVPVDVLVDCARRAPRSAMRFCPALLPLAVRVWCARRAPMEALRYCPALLPPKVREELARRAPVAALRYCADLLPPDVLEEVEALAR